MLYLLFENFNNSSLIISLREIYFFPKLLGEEYISHHS